MSHSAATEHHRHSLLVDPDNPMQDLSVDAATATGALAAVGITPSGTLAAAYVGAATDILLAVALARSLPAGLDYWGPFGMLSTVQNSMPVEILQMQVRLLEALRQVVQAEDGSEQHPLAPDRELVGQRLQGVSEWLVETLAEACEGQD